jgi:fatty acid desaturase
LSAPRRAWRDFIIARRVTHVHPSHHSPFVAAVIIIVFIIIVFVVFLLFVIFIFIFVLIVFIQVIIFVFVVFVVVRQLLVFVDVFTLVAGRGDPQPDTVINFNGSAQHVDPPDRGRRSAGAVGNVPPIEARHS